MLYPFWSATPPRRASAPRLTTCLGTLPYLQRRNDPSIRAGPGSPARQNGFLPDTHSSLAHIARAVWFSGSRADERTHVLRIVSAPAPEVLKIHRLDTEFTEVKEEDGRRWEWPCNFILQVRAGLMVPAAAQPPCPRFRVSKYFKLTRLAAGKSSDARARRICDGFRFPSYPATERAHVSQRSILDGRRSNPALDSIDRPYLNRVRRRAGFA